MTEQPFSLTPFPAPNIPEITITGKVSRSSNLLTLHYSLAGEIEAVALPQASVTPCRKDELWKATCFEFFLAIQDQPGYWEFNMSPSGDWNVYHMDAYRRTGFREETSMQQLAFELHKELGAFTLHATVDLASMIQEAQSLEMGITAILQTRDGKETYWALTHAAPQADFHLRKSFVLMLAGQTQRLGQSAPAG